VLGFGGTQEGGKMSKTGQHQPGAGVPRGLSGVLDGYQRSRLMLSPRGSGVQSFVSVCWAMVLWE